MELSNHQFFEKVRILGVGISRVGMEDALTICSERARAGLGGYVCFANVHSLTEAHQSSALNDVLNHSFLSVADGVPLVWTSRLKRAEIRSRVCGPDFMTKFLALNSDLQYGLIGGRLGQGEDLARRFNLQAGCYSPPMREFTEANALEDWQTFLSALPSGSRPPSVVWVGLGAPKQELWMHAVSPIAPETLFFGVGAAFDFLTDTKKRAPLWMQKSGLEWLFRLTQEPRRLWKRYLINNTIYVRLLTAELLRRRPK